MSTEFEIFNPWNAVVKFNEESIASVRKGILFEAVNTSSSITYGIEIIPPENTIIGDDYSLTLPNDDGNPGQALLTDGSGILSWGDATGGEFEEDANYNLFGGTDSGASLTTAVNNFLASRDSGTLLTTGSNNVAIGVDALQSATSSFGGTGNSQNICIGVGSMDNADGTATGENTDNIALGYDSMTGISTGSGNIGIGSRIAPTLSTGTDNIIIGKDTDVDDGARSGTILIGPNVTSLTNTQTCIGISAGAANANALYLRHRTSAVAANAAGWRTGDVNELIDSTSSARFKRDIRSWHPNEDNFDKLRPVLYKAISEPGVEVDEHDYIGFIAEEIADIYPEFVIYEGDWTTPRSVMYDRMVVLLVDEVKKLRQQVHTLQSQVNDLRS